MFLYVHPVHFYGLFLLFVPTNTQTQTNKQTHTHTHTHIYIYIYILRFQILLQNAFFNII